MVVSTEDGYGHMVYGDLQPLVVQTKTSFANIQIVTLSAPRVSILIFENSVNSTIKSLMINRQKLDKKNI